MNVSSPQVGYFVFSLDTELAWGGLWDQPLDGQARRNGTVEREMIRRLLDMMDEFGVVATWALTGHLFYEKCEECHECPVLELKGKDTRFERIWGTGDSLWYGADVVETLLARHAGHEIGFHGHTHRVFDKLSEEEARFEIQEWLRLAKRRGVIHHSVVFPQGRIGHLALFREAGFVCFRGKEVRHPVLAIPFLGKILNRVNLKLAFLPPQAYEVEVDPAGLVNVPSSQWLFRIDRKFETVLDWLNLHALRLRPTIKAIGRAAKERKVIHLWAHPQEFRTDKDFAKLRIVFERYAEEARAGRLRSITMSDLAHRTLRTLAGTKSAQEM